jgi:hypothetical protein
MPKQKVRQKHQKLKSPRRKSLRRRKTVVIGLILCLGLTGLILARWRSFRPTSSPHPVPSAAETSQTPGLSKEYIYAGGRLIATEEPIAESGPPPANLDATFVATVTPNIQVNVQWAAPVRSVSYYQVERSPKVNLPYETLSPNPTTTSFTDTTASPGKAYLYRVRAVYTTGGYSQYSNTDLATTIRFTDDPLISSTENRENATPIKAVHLNELRQAVNAVRDLAGLAAATWSYPDPVSTPAGQRRLIYLADVQELRTNLDAALDILGRSQPYLTDPTLSRYMAVKKNHFKELRDRVK